MPVSQQGWQIPRGKWEKCVRSGLTGMWKGSGIARSPSLDPSSSSRRTIALRMLGMGVRMSSRPGCPLPALGQLEAVLGRGGCGRAGGVFLCHRKQLPGVSQAGSGLPELLSQPANGKGCCVQTLRRNGSVTWNVSGCSLGLRAGFEPSPCPIPSACTEPPVCCSPEPGFAAGSLSLGEPGRLPSTLGGGSKGQEEESSQNTLELVLKEQLSSFLLKFLYFLGFLPTSPTWVL